MIEKIWQESMPGRCMIFLKQKFPQSLIGGGTEYIKENYTTSRTKQRLTRWSACFGKQNSLFNALLVLFNVWLFQSGAWVSVQWRQSLTGTFCRWVRRWPLWQNGFIMTGLRKLGLRRLAILLFALYLPLDYYLRQINALASVAGYWDEALLLCCVALVIWQRSIKRLPSHYTPLDAPLLFFMGVCVFLLFINSVNFSIGVAGLRATAQFMLCFFALTRLIEDEGDWQLLYQVLVGIGVVVGLHGIYQYIVAAPIPTGWLTHSELGVRTRAFSITGSPNILGDLMVMLMPLAVGMAYKKDTSWERKLFWWCCAGIMGLCCVVTFSRGAWLGLAVAALVFVVLQDRRLFAALLIAAGVVVFIPEIMNRLTFLFTDDFTQASQLGGRAGRAEIGLALLRGAGYTFGMGHGRYGGAVAMQNPIVEWLTYHYLDNYYLKTLVELGVVGLTSYLLLLGATLATLFRAVLTLAKSTFRPQVVAITASVAGVLAHCMYENIFEVPYMNAYFWGLIALACVAVRLSRGFQVNRKLS